MRAEREGDGDEPTGDPLEPILDAPEFPQPMYEALRDLAQDVFFPGLEHVPPNTVTLLETNSQFVESFLVGLNAELNRELLWRNYPTDQRGTSFRKFWDTSVGTGQPDIEPIHTRGRAGQLPSVRRGPALSPWIRVAAAGADDGQHRIQPREPPPGQGIAQRAARYAGRLGELTQAEASAVAHRLQVGGEALIRHHQLRRAPFRCRDRTGRGAALAGAVYESIG